MSTIKIKIKHLMLIIVLIPLLILALPYGYLFCADKISEGNPKAAAIMYKNYINAPPFIIGKDHAMFSLALKSFSVKGDSYYEKLLTDGSSTNSSYLSREMLDTAISLYKNILKNYKNSSTYEKAYNNLLFIYTYSANVKAGEALIGEGESSKRKSIRLIAAKYRLYYKLAAKQYSYVISNGHKFIEMFGDDRALYKLMADASLLCKDFDGAINYYDKAASSPDKSDAALYTLFQSGNYHEQASLIKALKETQSTNALVTGKVTILGKGVPFARVYLRKLSDNGMYSGEENEPSFAITDYNGDYTIKGAPLGSYNLLLVIPGFLLNATVLSENTSSNFTLNKESSVAYDFKFVKPMKLSIGHILKPEKGVVKLSWEPVDNAAYYTIHAILFDNPAKPGGNSIWIPISPEVPTVSYNLDLAAVNIMPTGFSIADNGIVNPQAYLGTFYPGCSVPVFVNAYDKNSLLLTSSISRIVMYANLPIISLDKRGLTKGEELILKGNPTEAEKVLRSDIKASPGNIRLMTILSNLYTRGTKVKIKANNNREVLGQDLNSAIALNNRLYALTKNPEYIRKNNYIYQYELKDYKGLLKSYKSMPASELTSNDYDTLGEAYLMLDKFTEARQNFDRMYKTIKVSWATNLNPILLYLYDKDLKAALAGLEGTNLKLYKVSTTEFINNIRALETTSYSNQEYEAFKKVLRMLLMHTLGSTASDNYKELMAQIKNPHLANLINQALSYHNIY